MFDYLLTKTVDDMAGKACGGKSSGLFQGLTIKVSIKSEQLQFAQLLLQYCSADCACDQLDSFHFYICASTHEIAAEPNQSKSCRQRVLAGQAAVVAAILARRSMVDLTSSGPVALLVKVQP